MFYAPQNEILTTDMQKKYRAAKAPHLRNKYFSDDSMIHITYMLGHTILY